MAPNYKFKLRGLMEQTSTPRFVVAEQQQVAHLEICTYILYVCDSCIQTYCLAFVLNVMFIAAISLHVSSGALGIFLLVSLPSTLSEARRGNGTSTLAQ